MKCFLLLLLAVSPFGLSACSSHGLGSDMNSVENICPNGGILDCAGVCAGTAILDCAGVCDGDSIEDCVGVCDGTALEDCAGICNGTAVEDCLGKCDGLAVEDCADVCAGTAILDCADVCNGPAVLDACGECNIEPGYSCCPEPVIHHQGLHDYTGETESYMNLDTDIRFDDEFSFTGWVRFNQWTGSYNRVFDFGRNDSYVNQSIRLHRNGGSTFRMAFNDWNNLDVPNYWVVGSFVFVTVTVDADGIWTIYKDGVAVSSQFVARCEDITWALLPNYYVAKSNWVGAEPNSNVKVHNLRWFDTVISPECIEALYQTVPESDQG